MADMFEHIASGGVVLSSFETRNYNVSFDFELNSSYFVYGTGDFDFNVELGSSWSVSAGKSYWYRVLFYCNTPFWSPTSVVDDTYDQQDVETPNLNPNINENNFGYCNRSIMRIKPIRLRGSAIISSSNSYSQSDRPEVLDSYFKDLENLSDSCNNVTIRYNDLETKCLTKKPLLLLVIAARDLSEVCSKLSNPKFGPPINYRICSIKKFVTPINESSGRGIAAELEEQDFSNVPECLNYTLDFDFTKFTQDSLHNNKFVFYATAGRCFVGQSNGNLFFGGSSNLEYSPKTVSGFIAISSEGLDLLSSFHSYEPNKNLEIQLNDQVDFVINPLIRNSLGGFGITSRLAFVAPIRNHEFLLDLSVQSNTKFNFCIKRKSLVNLHVSGSCEDLQHVYYETLTSLLDELFEEADGDSIVCSNYFSYESSGSVLMSSSSSFICNFRSYTFTGGVSITSSFAAIGMCLNNMGQGPIEIGGSSGSSVVYAFNFTKGISLGGTTADIISINRSYESKNNIIHVNGDIETNFTNLGLLVAQANFYSSYSNVLIESDVEDLSSNISVPNNTIAVCGCYSGLTIDLGHNIANGGVISDFLKKNKEISFDSNILLKYRSRTNSWMDTKNLIGIEDESFQFIFELSCTNIFDDQILEENYLKFNFYSKYRKTDKNLITNFSVYINPDNICINNVLSVSISRSFDLDRNENFILIDKKPTEFYTFYDNIGIFSNEFWNSKLNYSRLRPEYYPSGKTYKNPVVSGIFPEFRINFNETPTVSVRKVKLENNI